MTEQQLTLLVDRFYAKVRCDPLIGPLFNAAIANWPEHLEKLSAFWSSVMMTSGRYKGSPMTAHLKHAAAITPEMFDRWLDLWRETAVDTLDEVGAAAVTARRPTVSRKACSLGCSSSSSLARPEA